MSKFCIGDPVSAEDELVALLDYNGLLYTRQGGDLRLLFSCNGMKWLTVCRCKGSWAGIYGVYPFQAEDDAKALSLCCHVNSQAVMGSMFVKDKALVFRTGAELTDAYGAYEALARALEYNAAVITCFWQKMAACSIREQNESPLQAIKNACSM